MNHRITLGLWVALVLFLAAASASAADTMEQPGTQVAQFGQVKSEGAEEDPFADFDEYDDAGQQVLDPFEGWNKVWFYFNDGLYHGVFKPLATGYAWAIPAKPRQGVQNVFRNMLFPVRFVNNILQGKFDAAYMEFSMFIANTTWGLLGVYDVASTMERRWEPERPTADGFGQTLGKAGVGHGVYLVWPFIGPSSVRETVGWVADAYLDPLTYGDLTFLEFAAIRAYRNVNDLSLQLDGNEYETITDGAIDKYAAVRNAYIRYRAKKVAE